jgi:hypothetical protein
MTIKVLIDRLVVDRMPISVREGMMVKQAMEEELARLITAGGLSKDLVGGAAHPEVPASDISISGSDARAIGRQIARAVYGGIGPRVNK